MKTREVKSKDTAYESADLVERIEINLDAAQEEKLARWIDEQKSGIETDRNKFVERHKKYLYNMLSKDN